MKNILSRKIQYLIAGLATVLKLNWPKIMKGIKILSNNKLAIDDLQNFTVSKTFQHCFKCLVESSACYVLTG